MIRLIWKKNNKERKEFKLNSEEFTIGRETGSLIIPDDKYISTKHAKIFKDEKNKWVIEDCGSVNKIYVNNKIRESIYLHPGDKINIGQQTFIFCNDEETGIEMTGFKAWRQGPKMVVTLIIQGLLLTTFLVFITFYLIITSYTEKQNTEFRVNAAIGSAELRMRNRETQTSDYLFNEEIEKISKMGGKGFLDIGYSINIYEIFSENTPENLKQTLVNFFGNEQKNRKKINLDNKIFVLEKINPGEKWGVVWIKYSFNFIYKKMIAVALIGTVIYLILAIASLMLPEIITNLFNKQIDEFRMDLDAFGRKSISMMPRNYPLKALQVLAESTNRVVRRNDKIILNKNKPHFKSNTTDKNC